MSESSKEQSELEKQAFYLYPLGGRKYLKTTEQQRGCIEEKCELWRGVDSDNLVWCDNWNIGDCVHSDEKYGKPYGEPFIPRAVAEAELASEKETVRLLLEALEYINEEIEKRDKEIAEVEKYRINETALKLSFKAENAKLDKLTGEYNQKILKLEGRIAEANKIIDEFPVHFEVNEVSGGDYDEKTQSFTEQVITPTYPENLPLPKYKANAFLNKNEVLDWLGRVREALKK